VSVGPPLAKAMRLAFGTDTVAIKGVKYTGPTSRIFERHNGKEHGDKGANAKSMMKMAIQTAEECPQTRIVMAGYRNGAENIHGALASMPKNTTIEVCNHSKSWLEWI